VANVSRIVVVPVFVVGAFSAAVVVVVVVEGAGRSMGGVGPVSPPPFTFPSPPVTPATGFKGGTWKTLATEDVWLATEGVLYTATGIKPLASTSAEEDSLAEEVSFVPLPKLITSRRSTKGVQAER